MCHKKQTNGSTDIHIKDLIFARRFGRPDEHRSKDSRSQPPNFDYNYEEKFKRPPVPAPPEFLIDKLRITKYALSGIEYLIGGKPAESGGMLLSESHDLTVTGFIFDSLGSNGLVYHPNTGYLNQFLDGRDTAFAGIVHSHPADYRKPSSQNERSAWSNITSPGNPHLQAFLMPIVMTIPDTGKFEIIPYIVTCHPKGGGKVVVKRVKLEVLG